MAELAEFKIIFKDKGNVPEGKIDEVVDILEDLGVMLENVLRSKIEEMVDSGDLPEGITAEVFFG
jgi:hypothetical protein